MDFGHGYSSNTVGHQESSGHRQLNGHIGIKRYSRKCYIVLRRARRAAEWPVPRETFGRARRVPAKLEENLSKSVEVQPMTHEWLQENSQEVRSSRAFPLRISNGRNVVSSHTRRQVQSIDEDEVIVGKCKTQVHGCLVLLPSAAVIEGRHTIHSRSMCGGIPG